MTTPILHVRDLAVEFHVEGGALRAVRGVEFRVSQGETLAIVGESGCGKSSALQAVMGLISPESGRIVSGSAQLAGEELIGLPARMLNAIRGSKVGMIFQDPLTSLNPLYRIGDQLVETIRTHISLSEQAARRRASARSSCCARSASRRPSAGSTTIPTNSPAACASAS